MASRKLKEGQYVWVKDASIAGLDLFTKGHVLNINNNKVCTRSAALRGQYGHRKSSGLRCYCC